MSKLAAFLAVLLVAAHAASAFRTVVTTVEMEDTDNPSQQCRQQLMGADLSHCARYLQERQGSYGRRGEGYSRGGQHFEECCDGLKRIRNERCRCEGLQMEIQRMRQPEMRSVMRAVENLPSECRVGPSSCRFDSPYL